MASNPVRGAGPAVRPFVCVTLAARRWRESVLLARVSVVLACDRSIRVRIVASLALTRSATSFLMVPADGSQRPRAKFSTRPLSQEGMRSTTVQGRPPRLPQFPPRSCLTFRTHLPFAKFSTRPLLHEGMRSHTLQGVAPRPPQFFAAGFGGAVFAGHRPLTMFCTRPLSQEGTRSHSLQGRWFLAPHLTASAVCGKVVKASASSRLAARSNPVLFSSPSP